MIYGAIFVENNLLSQQKQRDGIVAFARKNSMKIDSFLSYTDTLNLDVIKPGDSVVFYAWSCVGNTWSQIKTSISYFVENGVNFYSATSEYYDEDIRFNFISNKNFELDVPESEIGSMYTNGETMYFSKKLNLSNLSVKHCLVEFRL